MLSVLPCQQSHGKVSKYFIQGEHHPTLLVDSPHSLPGEKVAVAMAGIAGRHCQPRTLPDLRTDRQHVRVWHESRQQAEIFLVAIRRRLAFHKRLLFLVHPAPAAECGPPFVGNLGQYIDPGPDILAALGVVRCRGQGRVWPSLVQTDQVRLATALMHGIRSDTMTLLEASRLEFEAAAYLWPCVDQALLKKISAQSLAPAVMDMIHKALEKKHLKKAFGFDEEKQTYYGGGNIKDKGGFQIPLGFLGQHTDRELLYRLTCEIIQEKFLQAIGRKE